MENALLNLDGTYDDSDSDSLTTDDSNQEWCSQSFANKKAKVSKGQPRQLPGPKSSRRIEDMTPEEINRRQRRRERNKAAAARCRQRRLDLTNQLLAVRIQTYLHYSVNLSLSASFKLYRDKLMFVFCCSVYSKKFVNAIFCLDGSMACCVRFDLLFDL
jgi:hypothetical protein